MQGLLELFLSFGDEEQVVIAGQGTTTSPPLAIAVLPTGLTLRDAHTDFGARQYSPTLRRWMTPDPLSEKYYGVSPYAFCNNNPVSLVDLNGMDWIKNTTNCEYQWRRASFQVPVIFLKSTI